MKKLLILFVTIILLSSCGQKTPYNNLPIIINKIKITAEGDCKYICKVTPNRLTVYAFKFLDTCGKFQIGDTVYLTK